MAAAAASAAAAPRAAAAALLLLPLRLSPSPGTMLLLLVSLEDWGGCLLLLVLLEDWPVGRLPAAAGGGAVAGRLGRLPLPLLATNGVQNLADAAQGAVCGRSVAGT
jgi:hypothetical protein